MLGMLACIRRVSTLVPNSGSIETILGESASLTTSIATKHLYEPLPTPVIGSKATMVRPEVFQASVIDCFRLSQNRPQQSSQQTPSRLIEDETISAMCVEERRLIRNSQATFDAYG